MIIMANNRKNLGQGKGSGYHNIIPKDPKVHSDSAKGIKQPQEVKKGLFARSKDYASERLKESKEKRQKARIKELETIEHPLIKSYLRQKDRVDELRLQIAEAKTEREEEKLYDELGKEQEQLRQKQEQITELDEADLSDSELKTMAIRHKDNSFFGSFFGSGNPYEDELVRRIKAEKSLEARLDKVRKEPVETGFFGL